MDSISSWIRENKLRAIGSFWLTSIAGSMAYQWSRPIPTSLKVLHTRVYAQALTLSALALAGVADVYEHRKNSGAELDQYKEKLHDLEKRFGQDSRQYKNEVKDIESEFGKGSAQ